METRCNFNVYVPFLQYFSIIIILVVHNTTMQIGTQLITKLDRPCCFQIKLWSSKTHAKHALCIPTVFETVSLFSTTLKTKCSYRILHTKMLDCRFTQQNQALLQVLWILQIDLSDERTRHHWDVMRLSTAYKVLYLYFIRMPCTVFWFETVCNWLNISKRITELPLSPIMQPDQRVRIWSILNFPCYRIRVYPHKQ